LPILLLTGFSFSQMANSGGSREWGVGTRVFQEQILATTIVLLFQAFHPVNSPFHPPDSLFPTPCALRVSTMSKISASSDTSPSPGSGATDSPWQPSWWQWLILALSGTLEIERQIAWLKKSNEEARMQHEQRMSELRKENERLAELESMLDAVLPKSVSN
jgi:hypothetical protein